MTSDTPRGWRHFLGHYAVVAFVFVALKIDSVAHGYYPGNSQWKVNVLSKNGHYLSITGKRAIGSSVNTDHTTIEQKATGQGSEYTFKGTTANKYLAVDPSGKVIVKDKVIPGSYFVSEVLESHPDHKAFRSKYIRSSTGKSLYLEVKLKSVRTTTNPRNNNDTLFSLHEALNKTKRSKT